MERQSRVISRGIRNPGVRQSLGLCTADFWSSLAYESVEQKPKHSLTPGFLIPLLMSELTQGRTNLFEGLCTSQFCEDDALCMQQGDVFGHLGPKSKFWQREKTEQVGHVLQGESRLVCQL